MRGLRVPDTTRLLGAPVRDSRPLHGGDLSQVARLTLSDGRTVVAKTGPLVEREARMLGAISAAGAPAPQVLGVEGDLMLLEALPETGASPAGWAALGQGLRMLHASTADSYGWPEDYAFGPVAIANARTQDWPAFWAERRLLATPGALPADLARRLTTLCLRLPELLPNAPPASLLHGDLWTGNALFTAGSAVLIDPAAYHGHAEVDLAMLHLFSTPPAAFWDGYGAPEPGWRDRLPLYQLWPALVHLRLFGSGYRGMVEERLTALSA